MVKIVCTVGEGKIYIYIYTLINSYTNYPKEMKLASINIDYFLLKYDALKFFVGFHLHGYDINTFFIYTTNI